MTPLTPFTRRQFVQLSGGFAALTLAGCTDDDNDATDPPSDSEGTAPVTGEEDENSGGSEGEEDEDEEEGEEPEETHTLTVTLLDTDGTPIEGMIFVAGQEVDSRVDGDPTEATIDLPPGEYMVTGDTDERPPKWTAEVETVPVFDDISVELNVYEPDDRKRIIVRSAGDVTVTMERVDDGASATRTIEEGRFEGLSVAGETRDGSVIFEAYPGRYIVTGEDVHGSVQEETVVVHRGGQLDLDELEPPAESTEPYAEVTFTVTNVAEDVISPPPVSGMIVKGKRIPDSRESDRVSEDLGVEFETNPTDADGAATARLHNEALHTAWVEDEDGTYYDPYDIQGETRYDNQSFDVEDETDVEIQIRY